MQLPGRGATAAKYLPGFNAPHPPVTHRPRVLLRNGIGQGPILEQQKQSVGAEPTQDAGHLLGQAAPRSAVDVARAASRLRIENPGNGLPPEPRLDAGARATQDLAGSVGGGPFAGAGTAELP